MEMIGDVGKSRAKKGRTATAPGLYRAAKEARRRHAVTSSCQREAKGGHRRVWKTREGRRRWGGGRDTVHYNYRIAIRFKIQITPKFV